MVKNKTHTKSLADVSLVFALPIPQGDNVEIKLEQSQCSFYLNEKIVEQIQQAQKTGLSLNIPPKLLIYLWFSTCFQYNFFPDIGEKNHRHKSTMSYRTFIINILRILRSKPLQNRTNIQIECTFNSYYSSEGLTSENQQQKDCILQTIVLFYGDVMQKIQEDFLHNHNKDNLMMVVSAHYWLIEQLLSSLRNKLNMLLWELASLFPAGFLVSKICQLNIFLLVLTWLGIALLVIVSRYILFQQLQKRVAINSQYLNWLAWGISCIIPAIAIILTPKIQAIDIKAIDIILFPIISAVAPLIVGQIFRLLFPPIMKLILRRFL